MHNSVIDAIGNTPLIKIPFDTPATVLAKLEYLNPGGSIKDRSALYMIEQAEKSGLLKPGGTIIEASSGNQGIAAAMIGAIKKYKVIITISEKSSPEKVNAIKAYGAHVVTCPATSFLEDPRSYHRVALTIHENTPNSFMINQYFNTQNRDAHYHLLGTEIWRQTHGKITHYFAAVGTGGTLSGAGRYLKEKNPAITVCGFDAATSYRSTKGNPQPYKLEGIGVDFDSPVIDYDSIDEIVGIHDNDAVTMMRYLASHVGLLTGPSSGAVAAGVANYISRLKPTDCAVMIFGDSGRAYLSRDYYQHETSTETTDPIIQQLANTIEPTQ